MRQQDKRDRERKRELREAFERTREKREKYEREKQGSELSSVESGLEPLIFDPPRGGGPSPVTWRKKNPRAPKETRQQHPTENNPPAKPSTHHPSPLQGELTKGTYTHLNLEGEEIEYLEMVDDEDVYDDVVVDMEMYDEIDETQMMRM